MFSGLFTHIVDANALLIRNIKGIRTSQHLFDDLTENQKEHDLAAAIADQDYINTNAALITRPFDYGTVITYPYVPQNWQMTRFSDGLAYGVWYGSLEIETTVYETAYHWQRFVLDSFASYNEIICSDRRIFNVFCKGIVIDLQNKAEQFPDLLHPTTYSFTNQVGKYLHSQHQNGILVKSARCPGTNAAIFTPEVLSDVKDICYLTYEFNPAKNENIKVKRDSKKLWLTIPNANRQELRN